MAKRMTSVRRKGSAELARETNLGSHLLVFNDSEVAYRSLRTGIWICHTPKIRGFVVLFARVEARIETIEITAHRSFFAVLTLSRYVNRITVGAGVRQ
jgi:hypothetical protein